MPTANVPLLSPTLHSVDESVEKTETRRWEDIHFPETKHISLLHLHPFFSLYFGQERASIQDVLSSKMKESNSFLATYTIILIIHLLPPLQFL